MAALRRVSGCAHAPDPSGLSLRSHPSRAYLQPRQRRPYATALRPSRPSPPRLPPVPPPPPQQPPPPFSDDTVEERAEALAALLVAGSLACALLARCRPRRESSFSRLSVPAGGREAARSLGARYGVLASLAVSGLCVGSHALFLHAQLSGSEQEHKHHRNHSRNNHNTITINAITRGSRARSRST